MLNAIKTMLINTPVVNVLFLLLFNGIFTRHIIKKYMEQDKISREQMIIILKDMNLTDKEIDNYLGKIKK